MESCGCDVKARVKALMAGGKTPFLMATVDAEGRPCVRWMGAVHIDADNEWVFYAACASNSRKMGQIAANPNMQLVFSKPDFSEVATLIGTAEAVACPETKKAVWAGIPECEQYFSGPEGEDFGVIRFTTKCMELLAMNEQPAPYCLSV